MLLAFTYLQLYFALNPKCLAKHNSRIIKFFQTLKDILCYLRSLSFCCSLLMICFFSLLLSRSFLRCPAALLRYVYMWFSFCSQLPFACFYCLTPSFLKISTIVYLLFKQYHVPSCILY